MKIKLPILVLIFMLGMISSRIIINYEVLPNVAIRMQHETEIFNNAAEPPYQYRLLQPAIAYGMRVLLSPLHYDPNVEHLISYSLMLTFVFWGIYFLLAIFLGVMFNETGVIIGLLLFQSVVPLSLSGYYMDGDYLTVLSYLIVFVLMVYKKDIWIPLIIFIAAFNREQAGFILLFYGIYLYTQGTLDKKHLLILGISFVTFLVVFVGVRLYFGLKPSQYTILLHIQKNTDFSNLINGTIPMWMAEVLGLVILSGIAFRKSKNFYKLSFIALGLYVAIFFVKGYLWELAKFLPAFLILIPMGMQSLTGEYSQMRTGGQRNSILV